MERVYADLIATGGVSLLLLAFALNAAGIWPAKGRAYLVLNALGSGLACSASVLIRFWPFVVLEAMWLIASVLGLLAVLRRGAAAKSTSS